MKGTYGNGEACWKIRIKPFKETNLGVAHALLI